MTVAVKRHRHAYRRNRKCSTCDRTHLYCTRCGRFKSKRGGFTWSFGKFYKD